MLPLSLKENSFHLTITIIIIVCCKFCTYLHDLVEEAYWNIQKIISDHGAFPSVFVWVWDREPGN